MPLANELSAEAREARARIAKSLALALALCARGASFHEVADRLRATGMADVDESTIRAWPRDLTASGEIPHPDVSSIEQLQALEEEIVANATHGRRRSEGTLKRAYGLAVTRGFVKPTDVQGVMGLLRVGQSTAYELCQNAIRERQDTLKSLAISMAARDMSQRAIAGSGALSGAS